MMNTAGGDLQADGARLAIVVGRFHAPITEGLLDGSMKILRRNGVDTERVRVVRCPGAFEIPLVAKKLAASGNYDAVICLGAVIRGATYHFEIIADGVASGIKEVALQTGIPVTLGVITTNTVEQAEERAGANERNKGGEAALAALEMVRLLKKL